MIAEFMQAVYRELAPSGTIRVAINFGNAAITHRDPGTGQAQGLAVDFVDDLARRLAIPRTLLAYESSVLTFEAGLRDEWDIAFLAVDPVRAERLDFTSPFQVLEGSLLVAADSRFRTVRDLDLDGVRIAVAEGSFHDHHLTTAFHHARLVRSRTFIAAIEQFLADELDAVAGLRMVLDAIAASRARLRVIEGRYAAVQQAIALPKGRSAALRYLNAFLADAKTRGRIDGARASWATDIAARFRI